MGSVILDAVPQSSLHRDQATPTYRGLSLSLVQYESSIPYGMLGATGRRAYDVGSSFPVEFQSGIPPSRTSCRAILGLVTHTFQLSSLEDELPE